MNFLSGYENEIKPCVRKIVPNVNLIQRCTFVVLTSCLYFYPNYYSSFNYCSFRVSSDFVNPIISIRPFEVNLYVT